MTTRCVLRPFLAEDLPAFVAYRALADVARYQSWSDYTLDDALKLFAAQMATPYATPDSWYQIALTLDGALIGDCALHFPAHEPDTLEIGFTLAPAYQGCGFMREALTALLDYIYRQLGRRRVIAMTDVENRPARKLLSALGFRQEGQFMQARQFKGRWCDECLYVCLAQEWQPSK